MRLGPRRSRRRALRRRVAGGLTIAVVLGAAGCGADDGGSGVAADSARAATCSPVGEELKAGAFAAVSVELRDFTFGLSQAQVGAGIVSFVATNAGSENHEVAFLPGGGEVPLTAKGEPDEGALGDAGAFELEAFGPGQSCSATYEMKPGTYTLFCIVTSADGRTHYEKGMRGELVVV